MKPGADDHIRMLERRLADAERRLARVPARFKTPPVFHILTMRSGNIIADLGGGLKFYGLHDNPANDPIETVPLKVVPTVYNTLDPLPNGLSWAYRIDGSAVYVATNLDPDGAGTIIQGFRANIPAMTTIIAYESYRLIADDDLTGPRIPVYVPVRLG